jgi:hypothetical protein
MAPKAGHVTPDLIQALTADAPSLHEAIQTELRKRPATPDELATACRVKPALVKKALKAMLEQGFNLFKRDQAWSLEPRPQPSLHEGRVFEYVSRPDNTFHFGCSSDKHLGSKYERLDVLQTLYAWFADQRVDRVFDAGNWIEGESRFNRFDIGVHGLEPQLAYAIEQLPRHEGLTTYAIHGDDHEGWYGQRESIDMGRFMQAKMREAGRTDWVDLGFMEAQITLVNANSGKRTSMLVMHPGGGSAYAVSYKPQKIVEALQGGEKPAVLLIGHYHKLSANLIRSVWALQIGCSQDSTPFLRKKGIEPSVGGMIVTLHQDPKTGAITDCLPWMRQYFVKGYYNDRWSKIRPPVLPKRDRHG